MGETPLECLNRFKAQNEAFSTLPMTYAGRLDPLAEGVLLVIAGEIDEEEKKSLMYLPKKYVVEIVFGMSTDSGDMLGLVNSPISNPLFSEEELIKVINDSQKITKMQYPAFSSKTVLGKPLWQYTREGENVEAPIKEVKIYSLEITKRFSISAQDFLEKIKHNVSLVSGDFRQEKIIASWEKALGQSEFIFNGVTISATVSSGTYMRVLAFEIGKRLSVPALALSICRTSVGEYKIEDSKEF